MQEMGRWLALTKQIHAPLVGITLKLFQKLIEQTKIFLQVQIINRLINHLKPAALLNTKYRIKHMTYKVNVRYGHRLNNYLACEN